MREKYYIEQKYTAETEDYVKGCIIAMVELPWYGYLCTYWYVYVVITRTILSSKNVRLFKDNVLSVLEIRNTSKEKKNIEKKNSYMILLNLT